MNIRLGSALPVQKTFAIGRDTPEVARAAEQIGYDSLWAGERVLFPESPADGLFGIPGLPWPDFYRSNAEPMVTLTLGDKRRDPVHPGRAPNRSSHVPVRLADQRRATDRHRRHAPRGAASGQASPCQRNRAQTALASATCSRDLPAGETRKEQVGVDRPAGGEHPPVSLRQPRHPSASSMVSGPLTMRRGPVRPDHANEVTPAHLTGSEARTSAF